ncbi:MAG: hypothetical protein QE267_08465 [Akkermansiaceae bacterium]|nr:hypothetical protein [Akkermansiaceae bacterium]
MIPRIALLLGLLTVSSLAQEPSVQTEILTIALDEAVDGLFFFDGKAAVPFQANTTGLSQPVTYIGPPRFVLRASAAEFVAKPPLPAPAAFVDLPPNAKRVLLCCLKSENTALKIVTYDISSTSSRAGDYRLFNFSKQALSVKLGGKSLALDSKLDKNISDSSWQNDVLDLPIQVATVVDGKARLVYSSVWGHRPGRRNFVFMFDGSHPSKPISISRFFDIPAKVKPPAP